MRAFYKVILFLSLTIAITSQGVQAGTTYVYGGHFTGDSTWEASGSPYIISHDIILNECRLTIGPGVKVVFANNGLRIGRHDYLHYNMWGELYAIGKPDSMIVFTSLSDSTNGWDGIYFHPYSDYGGHTSIMDYCVIEKAGQDGWGVQANIYSNSTIQPTISNSIIRDASGVGMYIENSSPSITSCQFYSNNTIGIYCLNSSPQIHSSTIHDNINYGRIERILLGQQ